jgi:uncharacterized integral membrane protein
MSDDVSKPDKVTRADDVGREGRKLTPHQIIAIVLVALLVLVAVLNLDETHVDLVITSIQLPLFVVIAVAGFVGFAIGWLLSARREKRLRED